MAIKAKNRAWVKWAATGFLVVMLLLTFFSNTIRNHSLPQVSTQRVTSGTITPELTGGGQTESAGLTQVEAPASGVVTGVLASTGDKVEKGQVILTVALRDDGTLAQCSAQLAAAESEYESALLRAGVTQGSSESAQLQQLKNNLSAAESRLAQRKAYESERTALEQSLEEAEARYTQARKNYDAATGDAAAAQAAAERNLEDAKAAQVNAQVNESYYRELCTADPSEENQALYGESSAMLAQANRTVLDCENALFAARQTLTALEREYEPELTAAESTLAQAQRELETLDAEYAELPDLLSCENDLLAAQAALADFNDSLSANMVSRQLEDKALKEKEEQILTLRKELQQLEDALGQQEITALCSGILRDFSWNQNDSFTSGQALASLDPVSGEYTVRFAVTLEESRQVQPGIEASITNGERLDAQVVLKQITPSESDPTGRRDLVFSVTGGDVSAGMYLNLSIMLPSTKYDTVVPNSALYRDSLGDFVYVVDSTSSAAGTRTSVRRITVEALESDSRYTAVRGDLTDRDYVVTLSNAPLKDGQSVRLGNG